MRVVVKAILNHGAHRTKGAPLKTCTVGTVLYASASIMRVLS